MSDNNIQRNNYFYSDLLYPLKQLHLPQWSIPRSPTQPRRRPCVCAGVCSLTTRWSTTSSTTDPCWRTHRQTVPTCHLVWHGTLHHDTYDCSHLIGLLLTCHHEEDMHLLFSVSKIKVKETHCTVTDLVPNAQYELWVTATNTTGISPASEKALYMTGRWSHSHIKSSLALLSWDLSCVFFFLICVSSL